jgi:TP901 family phage tail tape measure protein
MATNTVEIIINATDNASDKLDKIGGGLQTFGTKVQAATQPLADLAAEIAVLEAAMAAVAMTITTKAIDAAREFNTQFGEISTMISGPKDNLGEFKDSILEYAQSSTQSMESITKATYNAISMGADYKDSLGVVATAEKLASAGKAELNSTLEVIMGSLNAYGKSMDSASEFSDKLFTTVKLGKTTIPELGASLSQVTSIAASTGVSFDEVLAALATLTAAGMPTAEAVTSIKAAISGLTTDTGAYADAAASMGIKMGVTEIQSKGLAGMMEEIRVKTGGSEEKIKSMFGSMEAYGAVVTLAGTGNGKFVSSLDEIKNNVGATSEAFAKMEKNVNQLLANNVDVFFIKLGDGLDQSANDMKTAIASIFGGLSESADAGAFDPIKDAMKTAIGDISAELTKLGENLPAALEGVDFSGVVKIIKDAGETIKGFFKDLGSDNPDRLRETIQKVIDVFVGLHRVFVGVVEGFSPVIGAVKEAISWFAELSPETQEMSGEIVGVGVAINNFMPLVSGLGEGFSLLGDTVGGLSETFKTFSTITELIKDAPEKFKALGDALSFLGSALTSAGPAIGIVAAAFVGWKIGEWATENIPAIKNIQTGLSDLIESVFGLADAQAIASGDEQMASMIADLSAKTGDATITAENYRLKLREYLAAQKEATEVTQAAADPVGALSEKLKDLSRLYLEQTTELGKMKEAGLEGTEEYKRLEQAIGETEAQMEDTKGVLTSLTEAQAGLTDEAKKSTEGMGEQGTKILELKEKLVELGKTYAQQVTELDNLKEAGKEGTEEYKNLEAAMGETKAAMDTAQGSLTQLTEEQKKLAEETQKATENAKAQASELDSYKSKLELLTKTYQDQQARLAELNAEGKQGSVEWQALTGSMNDTKEQIDKTNSAIEKIEGTQGKAKEKTKELHEELSSLSNDQKVKLIESRINLNAEEVKADAQKVIAAFESINTTIKATGDVMSSALGKLGDNWKNDSFLKDVIKEELQIQKEATSRQNQLLDSQIKNIEAKNAALGRGDSMISISADGLEPEIQAFMMKIIEKIQMKVNSEGLEFLLGAAASS